MSCEARSQAAGQRCEHRLWGILGKKPPLLPRRAAPLAGQSRGVSRGPAGLPALTGAGSSSLSRLCSWTRVHLEDALGEGPLIASRPGVPRGRVKMQIRAQEAWWGSAGPVFPTHPSRGGEWMRDGQAVVSLGVPRSSWRHAAVSGEPPDRKWASGLRNK